mgnify:CR=1 FL=1
MTPNSATRIRALGHIANLVNAGNALSEVLDSIVAAVCQRSAWSSSAIMAVDESTKQSVLVARHDPVFSSRISSKDTWALSTSPSHRVIKNLRPIVIRDAQADETFRHYRKEAIERDYRTVVLLPLGASDAQGRGLVLSVHAPNVIDVDEEEMAFLETTTTLAALALERAHSEALGRSQYEQLQTALAIHDIAMEHVFTSEDLESFAELMVNHINRPFILVDLTTDALRPGGGAFVDVSCSRQLLHKLGARLKNATLGKFETIEDSPYGLNGPTDIRKVIVEPCIVGGYALGGIVFVADRALDFAEASTALELRAALTVLLLRRHIRFQAQAETHGEYFAHLFAGGWKEPAAILVRAQHLGIPLASPAVLALSLIHI